MPRDAKSRIAILISGRGSNMLALADAVREGRVPEAEIAVVISDQPSAAGLARGSGRAHPSQAGVCAGVDRKEEAARVMITIATSSVYCKNTEWISFVLPVTCASYLRFFSRLIKIAY